MIMKTITFPIKSSILIHFDPCWAYLPLTNPNHHTPPLYHILSYHIPMFNPLSLPTIWWCTRPWVTNPCRWRRRWRRPRPTPTASRAVGHLGDRLPEQAAGSASARNPGNGTRNYRNSWFAMIFTFEKWWCSMGASYVNIPDGKRSKPWISTSWGALSPPRLQHLAEGLGSWCCPLNILHL